MIQVSLTFKKATFCKSSFSAQLDGFFLGYLLSGHGFKDAQPMGKPQNSEEFPTRGLNTMWQTWMERFIMDIL